MNISGRRGERRENNIDCLTLRSLRPLRELPYSAVRLLYSVVEILRPEVQAGSIGRAIEDALVGVREPLVDVAIVHVIEGFIGGREQGSDILLGLAMLDLGHPTGNLRG